MELSHRTWTATSRAEFCKVAVKTVESLGRKDSLFPYLDNDTYPSFSDTSDPDVIYMAKAGIVTDYGDGLFRVVRF